MPGRVRSAYPGKPRFNSHGKEAMSNPNTTHATRVRNELKTTGISHIALLRFTSRFLPKVIHENEHIKAAVYGHHKTGGGMLDFTDGILVATDRRLIYMDHAPGFTTMDEITYEVVSGVNVTKAGPVSSITLFTKVGNYTISFARPASIQRFADYIESRRLTNVSPAEIPTQPLFQSHKRALDFIASSHVGVLSTIDRSGNVTGATVYYALLNDAIYILTKEGTRKARNIFTNPQVALTIFDSTKLKELQIEATARVETDATAKNEAFNTFIPSLTQSKLSAPLPVEQIHTGAFVIFQLTPTSYNFSDFSTSSIV